MTGIRISIRTTFGLTRKHCPEHLKTVRRFTDDFDIGKRSYEGANPDTVCVVIVRDNDTRRHVACPIIRTMVRFPMVESMSRLIAASPARSRMIDSTHLKCRELRRTLDRYFDF